MNFGFKFGLFLFSFIFINNITAQVGIGTTAPDASSILDIESTSSGVLLPRVLLTSTTDNTTINNPAISLLVYNTNNASDVTPGFYYWNASSWSKLGDGVGGAPATGWGLSGNNLSGGTGNEFLGTTSWHPLTFKVNNSTIGYLHMNKGIAFGLGSSVSSGHSVAIGWNANASAGQTLAIGYGAIASAYQAMSFGLGATASANNALALGLNAVANGQDSAALGMNSRTNGLKAIALGVNAVASGQNSAALGMNSNTGTSAQNSLALGVNAVASGQNSATLGMDSSASGQNALALGKNAVASGQDAMAIGNGSVANNPNTIILGNTLADSPWGNGTKIGLGTSNPTVRLDVVGSVKIVDGTEGAGKVLTSDADGKASWEDASSQLIYGEIYKSATSSSQNLNTGNAITFGTTGFAQGVTANNDNIQILTGGMYRVSYTLSLDCNTIFWASSGNLGFNLASGGGAANRIAGTSTFIVLSSNARGTVSMTKIIHLNAYQRLYLYPDTSHNSVSVIPNTAVLNIELIKAD